MAGSRVFRGLSRASTGDRKSTRLNSSHGYISYAVFCLKKKKDIYSSSSTVFNPIAPIVLSPTHNLLESCHQRNFLLPRSGTYLADVPATVLATHDILVK